MGVGAFGSPLKPARLSFEVSQIIVDCLRMLIDSSVNIDDEIKIKCRIFQFLGLFVVPFGACSAVSNDVGCARGNSSGVAFYSVVGFSSSRFALNVSSKIRKIAALFWRYLDF